MAEVIWDAATLGLRYMVQTEDGLLPTADWVASAAKTSLGEHVRFGPLLRLLEEGHADQQEDGSLLVQWDSIADLASNQLRGLGLPGRAALSLNLNSQGSPASADFHVSYQFVGNDGTPRSAVRRIAALLDDGVRKEVLPNPLFRIIEAIDRLNGADELNAGERMLAWGEVTELFSDEVSTDDYLGSYRITVASAFTLEPFLDENLDPDFNPIVGKIEHTQNQLGEETSQFRSTLTTDEARAFEKRFRKLGRVKSNNPLGENRYVVAAPEVLPALQVVRDFMARSPREKREFLERPSLYLREALENAQADFELDQIFADEGLSERVRGVGIWQSRVLPWIQRSGKDWLPPEKVGLLLGDLSLEIKALDLPSLEGGLRAALDAGQDSIKYGQQDIPANSETLEAVSQLRSAVEQRSTLSASRDAEEGKGREKQILLIRDNLEELGYQSVGAARPGNPGEVPACLRAQLLPHQTFGLEWLQQHWTQGSTGALLADDMGLGKTLQAVAFLAWTRELDLKNGASPKPLLVVAPTGLIKNWVAENCKHLLPPGLGDPLEVHGRNIAELRKSKARELTTGFPMLDLSRLREADWVLTTYETLRDYQHSFARIHWSVAVFDEAQRIKNPAAGVTDAVLAMNINFCIMMTGTPVENRPSDIWPIVDRAQPGRLGTLKDFSRTYESIGDASPLRQLKQTLCDESGGPSLMLRRMKRDHLDGLPECTIHPLVVDMQPLQADAYTRVVEGAAARTDILGVLHDLRAVSLHPDGDFESNDEEFINDSARLSEAFRILQEISATGEKVLLFCDSLEMQEFLMEALPQRFRLPGPVRIINGSVPGSVRQERVDEFQKRRGFDVMLLTPRAGGVGLTLTAANHVIHLSRWWNPAVEDQCTDRVVRIGQTRSVNVYIPIARHPIYDDISFDLKLDALLSQKREMSHDVLAPIGSSKEEMDSLYRETLGV